MTSRRTFRDGLHIPSSKPIGSAFAAWKRGQPLGKGAYYDQAPTSPRNANPRNE